VERLGATHIDYSQPMSQPSKGGHPSTLDPTPSTASKVLANTKCRTVVQYLIAKETDTTDLDELDDSVHEEIDTITMGQIRLSYQIENPRSENFCCTG
jgi:hypothetical protein